MMDGFSISAVALLIAFVAAAAVGAVARYGVGLILNRVFPWGTLVVNLVASLVMGLATGADWGRATTIVVGTGMLGALSTWSTVADEAAVMARSNEGHMALAYLALTVLSGVVMAWIGLRIGAML
jgi:CrcB protein